MWGAEVTAGEHHAGRQRQGCAPPGQMRALDLQARIPATVHWLPQTRPNATRAMTAISDTVTGVVASGPGRGRSSRIARSVRTQPIQAWSTTISAVSTSTKIGRASWRESGEEDGAGQYRRE